MRRLQFGALAFSLLACVIALLAWRDARKGREATPPEAEARRREGWLRGSSDEKFEQLEKQLRGFDKTMVEIGYRFTELYFAGKDRNWEYAEYQAEKIDAAIRLGIERRPKRAGSARYFLEEDLPAMRAVLEKHDAAGFDKAAASLRQSCMRCHARENVPYFTVELPERRLTPIRRAPR